MNKYFATCSPPKPRKRWRNSVWFCPTCSQAWTLKYSVMVWTKNTYALSDSPVWSWSPLPVSKGNSFSDMLSILKKYYSIGSSMYDDVSESDLQWWNDQHSKMFADDMEEDTAHIVKGIIDWIERKYHV